MAWAGNTLYTLTWEDLFHQSCTLRIRKQNYKGSSTTVRLGGDPVQIKYDTPSDYLLDPVNGSQLTFELYPTTTFQFQDLYTSNNREFRVEYDVAGGREWNGFMQQEQYQAEYKQAPYPNKFKAVDQLGFLRTLVWDHSFDTSIQYGLAIPTLLKILEWIFTKTDLALNIREGINVYEDAHDSSVADSPLDQTYGHGIAFEGKTYYDVLEDTLKKFQAVLKQRNGMWFIFRPTEAILGDFTTRLWTYSTLFDTFTYASNAVTNVLLPTTAASVPRATLVRIANKGSTWNRPAWRKYTLKQDYRTVQNRMLNGDFSAWTNDNPDHWTVPGGFTLDRKNGILHIPPLEVGQRDPATAIFQLINTYIRYWTYEIKYNVEVFTADAMTVYFRLGTTNFSKTYDNTGGSEPLRQSVRLTGTVESRWVAGPPAYRLLTAAIEQPVMTEGGVIHSYIQVESVVLRPLVDAGTSTYPYEDAYEDEKILDINRNYDGGDVELIMADAPLSVEGFRDVFRGALFKGFDPTFNLPIDQTVNWTADGVEGTLLEHLDRIVGGFHVNPQRVLAVRIYSKLIDCATILQEVDNDNILFMIKRARWHPKLGYWDVEAHEVGQGEPDKYLLGRDDSSAEEYYLVDEHGNKIELW